MSMHNDVFGARTTLAGAHGTVTYYRLEALTNKGVQSLEKLPFTVKIILENALRQAGGDLVTEDDVLALAHWIPGQAAQSEREYPFLPARVLLQDFTGVPAVADLAAMRSAISRMQGDPQKVNPLVPADLVIDHSVQVDSFGSMLSFARNVEREYERNSERYALLRWGQQAFSNFRVVPPGTGIVPPGQPGVPGICGHDERRGWRDYCVPRYACWHGLAYYHGQRSGCAGLGRWRH